MRVGPVVVDDIADDIALAPAQEGDKVFFHVILRL